jgi:hypothetical protein
MIQINNSNWSNKQLYNSSISSITFLFFVGFPSIHHLSGHYIIILIKQKRCALPKWRTVSLTLECARFWNIFQNFNEFDKRPNKYLRMQWPLQKCSFFLIYVISLEWNVSAVDLRLLIEGKSCHDLMSIMSVFLLERESCTVFSVRATYSC